MCSRSVELLFLASRSDDDEVDATVLATTIRGVVGGYGMIGTIACYGDAGGGETGVVNEHGENAHGAGGRELPVGVEGAVVDRLVVGVAFDSNFEAMLHEDLRGPLELVGCAG